MSAAKSGAVPRPIKKGEFQIQFATSQAAKGWTALLGTTRNALVDAWDFLTRTPEEASFRCHQLKGELAYVTHHGESHERWQYELPGGARIWFYVSGQTVFLINVHTHHPNETK